MTIDVKNWGVHFFGTSLLDQSSI